MKTALLRTLFAKPPSPLMTLFAPATVVPAVWPRAAPIACHFALNIALILALTFATALGCGGALAQSAAASATPAAPASAANHAASLGQVELALKANPADASLRFKRAVLLADAGRNTEALALLRQLSEQYPDLVEPLNNQAVLLSQAGELDAARQALEQALRLDPHHVLVRQNLGEVYLLMAQRTWEGVPTGAREAAQMRRLELLKGLLASPR